MLKKWIEEIRNNSDRYKSSYWKYHISGNVVELSILPAYMKQRTKYRSSVIVIGQILKKLSYNIEQKRSYFHIQSFPNLENPGVVASIRMDESSLFSPDDVRKHTPAITQKNQFYSTIQSLAKQYQLTLEKFNPVENGKEFKKIKLEEYPVWLTLYSAFDNPFTWLNIGYWKESVLLEYSREMEPDSSIKPFDFSILDELETTSGSLSKPRQKKYLQALMGIEEVEVDYP